jgi:hypothetical protein
MRLLQKQFSKRRLGNANLVSFKQVAIMQIEIIKSVVNGTLGKDWTKESVGRVKFLDLLKTQNVKLKAGE